MSIQTEIDRIITAVGAAYDAVEQKGGTVPQSETVAGLAEAIGSIPLGGAAGGVNVSYNTVEPNRYSVDLDNYTAQLDLTGLVAGSHYICVMYFNGRALDGQNMSIMEDTTRYTISVFSTGSEQNDGVTYSILSYGSGDCSTQYNSPLVLNLGQLLDSTKNSTAYGMAYNITEMTGSMIVSWD